VGAVKTTAKKVTKKAAATVDASTDAVADVTAAAVESGKKVAKTTKKTAKQGADAVSADLDAMNDEVKKAAARASEAIDEAIEAGTATSADIRKALEDLIGAIEGQKVFVDIRKSLDGILATMKSSKTVDFVQQTVGETSGELRRRPFRDMLQRALFAGIGVAALTRDEAEAFVNRLVQRGDIPAEEAEEVVEDVMAGSKKQAARFDTEVDKRVRKAIETADLPSSEDIEDLNARIAALQRKVEELSKKVS
jgi:polyhydroxyalkanoate synthesis regulator phasin